MKVMKQRLKKVMKRDEAKEKTKQEQLDRIEVLLRQRIQVPPVEATTKRPSDEANLPPMPAATKGYVCAKLENEFLRSNIHEIKEDIKKMKFDIWKIKGHVQQTLIFTILLTCMA